MFLRGWTAVLVSGLLAATGTAQQAPKPEGAQKLEVIVDAALAKLATIPDYTYTLRKQERVNDDLLDPQTLQTKIRHEPFSVYLKFTEPKSVRGKEALYVEGQNDGKLIGKGVGVQALFGAQKLDPRSAIAMMGNRNPITDSGMKNMLLKLKAVLERPDALKAYEFTALDDEELVDKRPCFVWQIRNPRPTKEQLYSRSRICFDREWQLPTRFQRWYWSQPLGGKELLVEDYTYQDLKFDCGLSDKDFDPENPDYGF
jgi:hypothetical protein